MTLAPVDYLILSLYFAFVLGIGWLVKRKVTTSEDFLTSGRSVPVWITSLAFIAANLGAQEVIGMCASGAKYGIMTAHFYWIGAVPAMLFVGVFMMPFYYGSRARSVPEYLKLRFDEKTRALNAITFAVMTVFSSGISMYALGLLFQLVLGWSFTASVLLSAAIVLIYTFLGGLTSAIYNEVLQFFLIVLGFAPLSIMAVLKAGGWRGMSARLPPVMTHAWSYLKEPSQNPMGVEVFGLVAGLGFVLSFGYWCTDFLVVQRAMAADSMSAARRTPLIAAFPKMIMPFIVIVPGSRRTGAVQDGAGLCTPAQAGWRTRLRSSHDHADGAILSFRHAGPGAHRADGVLYVGHGRQRHGFQYGVDLRSLSRLHPQARAGLALPFGGPHHNRGGRGALARDGVSGQPLQQHHGFSAAGIRVRKRPAFCDVSARNVLEARNRTRGLYWTSGGHASGRGHARFDVGGEQRRVARDGGSHFSIHHGAELLDRYFCLVHLFGGDNPGESFVSAETGGGVA